MRILFRQSGGLLGIPRECDTANLTEPAAREAKELLKQAGVHGSLHQTSRSARDAARYELTIIDGNKTKRIVTDDVTLPPQLSPLIELLREHSRPAPLKKRGAEE
jgi:hypothetical protein